MSILYPAMLAGVVGLAVPVVLHLIARHRFPVQRFPTIRFLHAERRANVFAWKLVDVPQLLLRALVLALLVLAMARPFAAWLSSGRAPRNLVVVVDASASMRAVAPGGNGQETLFDRALSSARALLSEVAPPSQCALVAAGESASLLRALGPGPEEAIAALDGLETCDGAGPGLVHAVAEACEQVLARREVKSQVVVLTDLHTSALATRNRRDLARIRTARERMGDKLEILFVRTADGAVGNVGVVDARRRGGEVRVGDDAHVVARILNSGAEEVEVTPRLSVGGSAAPAAKRRGIPSGGEIVVDLTARMNRAVRTFAEVDIVSTVREPSAPSQPTPTAGLPEEAGERSYVADALAHDNVFRLPLQVADARRVLIVNGAGAEPVAATSALEGLPGAVGGPDDEDEPAEERLDGAMVLRYVLNPGRELGLAHGTGVDPTLVAPDAFAAQTLSKYDVIVLYDVSSLPEKAMAELDTFVRQGRALVIVASGGLNPMRFNRTLASGTREREPLSPAQIGNDIELPAPSGLADGAVGHPVLAAFADRRQGDLSVVRFTRLREVRAVAPGASVMFSDGSGRALAVERRVGLGSVVLLAFGLELSRGNVARTRVFPPMVWRLVDYLTGRIEAPPSDTLVALERAVVGVSEPQFAFVDELELTRDTAQATGAEAGARAAQAPEATRLRKTEAGTVLVAGLPAGKYLLHKPRRRDASAQVAGYARPIVVNVDPRESDTRPASAAELAGLFGPDVKVIPRDRASAIAPTGAELCRWILAALVLAYAAEALVGWRLSAKREEERSAEAAT